VTPPESPDRNPVAVWRIAAAVAILAALAGFLILFAPVYFHNLQLQSFVAALTRDDRSQSQPDGVLRAMVLDKAYQLDLPVQAGNVQIHHSADGIQMDIKYFVRVSFPGYTVDLHFVGNR
jgi:hypothetical protein